MRLFDCCEEGSSAADFVADLTDVTDVGSAADFVADLTDVTDVTD